MHENTGGVHESTTPPAYGGIPLPGTPHKWDRQEGSTNCCVLLWFFVTARYEAVSRNVTVNQVCQRA